MKVGNRKFCCIAKSKLAKLLRAVRQRKEGARRSKEQVWGARILDEEEQQGRHDGRKSLVLSPPEPPLPPQPRLLWEQIEEQIEGMHKRNRELAGRMHAHGGARGGERPEGQGNGELPAPPATPPSPPSSSRLEQLEQVLEQLEQVWESAKLTNERLEERLRRSGQRQRGGRGKQWAPTPSPPRPTQRLRRGMGAPAPPAVLSVWAMPPLWVAPPPLGTPPPWGTQPQRGSPPPEPSPLQPTTTPPSAADPESELEAETGTATEGTGALAITAGRDTTAMTCSQPPPLTEEVLQAWAAFEWGAEWGKAAQSPAATPTRLEKGKLPQAATPLRLAPTPPWVMTRHGEVQVLFIIQE